MGVSFRHCESCNDSLYDEYVGSCTDCGNSLCTNCLVNDDIDSRFAYQYGVKFDSTDEKLIAELLKDGYITKDENGDYDIEEGELIDDSAIQPKYCPFCQGDSVDNDAVLAYLLKNYNLDIKDVWKEMKNK
jgi:hypothetical protein